MKDVVAVSGKNARFWRLKKQLTALSHRLLSRWKIIKQKHAEKLTDDVSKFVIEQALQLMPPQKAKKFMAQIKAKIKNTKLIAAIQTNKNVAWINLYYTHICYVYDFKIISSPISIN